MTQEITRNESLNLAAIAVDGITLVKDIWLGAKSRDELIKETANFVQGVDRIMRAKRQADSDRYRNEGFSTAADFERAQNVEGL